MAREAWPNALHAQIFNSIVGVYFLSKMKWGVFRGVFFPQTEKKATGQKSTSIYNFT